MTTEAIKLANSLLLDGFGLRIDGEKILVAPPVGRKLDAERSAEIKRHKADLVALLKTSCPRCKRPLDANRACWRCGSRPCEGCGKDTGSCFIATCVACGNKLEDL